jgi:hypothetical protein
MPQSEDEEEVGDEEENDDDKADDWDEDEEEEEAAGEEDEDDEEGQTQQPQLNITKKIMGRIRKYCFRKTVKSMEELDQFRYEVRKENSVNFYKSFMQNFH